MFHYNLPEVISAKGRMPRNTQIRDTRPLAKKVMVAAARARNTTPRLNGCCLPDFGAGATYRQMVQNSTSMSE
jgi:hypothetical protein